jgi:uncharacterized protein YjbJ (UPF0337 family)
MDANTIEGTVRNFTGKAKDATGAVTGDAKLQADGKLDQAIGAGQQAYGDAVEMAKDVADKTASAADRVAAQVSEAARAAGAQVSQLGERAYAQATQGAKFAGRQVQEQPLTALLLAGVVGGIVGHLLTSRR